MSFRAKMGHLGARTSQSGAVAAVTSIGVCILLPYNCFLQAQPYFARYLFAGRGFPFISMICSSLPQCIAATVFTSKAQVFTVQCRMCVAFLGYTFFCLSLVAIPNIVGVLSLDAVYILTLFSIAVSATATALMQNSVLGFTATIGEKLSNAVMSGVGLSGIVSSVIAIVCDAFLTHQGFMDEAKQLWTVMIMFAGCAVYVLLSMWIFHRYLCRRHGATKAALQRLEGRRHSKLLGIEFDPNCDLEVLLATPPPSPETYLGSRHKTPGSPGSDSSEGIIAEAWTQSDLRWHSFNVWLIFAVSLSIFPGVITQWTPLAGSAFEQSADRFILLLVSTFQVFDVVGRYAADWFARWIPSEKLVFFVVLRVIFIPVFMLGQRRPTWSWIWGSDVGRLLLVASMALTNGIFATCAMMFGPSRCPEAQKEVAGSVMSTSLYAGIMSGCLGALLTQF